MIERLGQDPQQLAAEILLYRRKARADFRSWCLANGFKPAQHHDLLIQKFQEVTDSLTPRYVIFMLPPGAAKSTYTSQLAPPWFLGRKTAACILACSYKHDLAKSFGRKGRNYAEQNEVLLGYTLKSDSQAADEWETSNGGRYFCAGVGSGIAGHRADLGLIDDYLGSQEDADSETVRNKQWLWFWEDFYPRLKPIASIIIIANRRNEDDLIGRLLDPKTDADKPIQSHQWEVISIPFFAKDNDVLGRTKGERLWPEWFTVEKAHEIRRMPSRTLSGLYQQNPTPDEGDYFKVKMLKGYEPQDLPPMDTLRIYGGADFACDPKKKSDKTAFFFGGLDANDVLWILPRAFYDTVATDKSVESCVDLGKSIRPITWWMERGQISKSIGPFLFQQMRQRQAYFNIEEVTPVQNKGVRARSIQGRMSMGMVRFPKYASWWAEVESELLHFTGSGDDKHDDAVDALAYIGLGLDKMFPPRHEKKEPQYLEQTGINITLNQLKGIDKEQRFEKKCALLDY